MCVNAQRVLLGKGYGLDVLVVAVPAYEIAQEDRDVLFFDLAVLIEVGSVLVDRDTVPFSDIARERHTVRYIHSTVGVDVSQRLDLCC